MRTCPAVSILLAALLLPSCGPEGQAAAPGADGARPRVAYVTNGVADFWTHAEAGALAGAAEFDVDLTVLMPAGGITEQKTMIEDCVTKQVNGIALSPIDPVNQVDQINRAARVVDVITHDSDAPGSERLAYVGMDNYAAGLMCGELVREAIPDGGKVAIFIGRLEQDNAKRRRQGVIDGLLGRQPDPSRFDPPNATPSSADGRFQVIGTYTDNFDRARGKANVEDALSRHPDLACCTGLFGYNPPLILEALKGAEKLGQVAVVAFDEDESTLRGIAEGTVHGTVVQNPYRYGYESVRILAGLARGEDLTSLGLGPDGYLDIPARQIRPDNVAAFKAELQANKVQASPEGGGSDR